jgi:hypothetical protein
MLHIKVYNPAHFDTLVEAKRWVNKMQKPDVEYIL